ncbi:MAG: radical SAM protein [Chloroflexi bacterium]|nr:radical SAM protein [Chloroflexota bacterium]MBU1746430.1 radical SAM protein [Chloroflexota bacterium]MBU1877804.1 radical SAM protein [Chloroflexota bacterium]
MSERQEARLYKPLEDASIEGSVRCGLCTRGCVVAPGHAGFCGTRRNRDGVLLAVNYAAGARPGGLLAALESRPIEIKPFFHFYPGTTALTYAGRGCNLRCAWCQNAHLSRTTPNPARDACWSPEELVALALTWGDAGLSCSFSEPTLLHEFNRDVFRLARAAGLYTCYVSNGLISFKALRELASAGLDAVKIDVKGDDDVYYQYCQGPGAGPVWSAIRAARDLDLHLEIVYLMVPGVNDSEADMFRFIGRYMVEAGPDVPLHLTRYHPAGGFSASATPIATLERAWQMARAAGVRYPYLGNVAGHPGENTTCPTCGKLLIERHGDRVQAIHLTADNGCPDCGEVIPIVNQRPAEDE